MSARFLFLPALLLSAAAYGGPVTIAKPTLFEFGSSIDEMVNRLKPLCRTLRVRSIAPITAPLATQRQDQIDCSGFAYAGKDRDIELVFQDDQLDIVWILFPAEERAWFVEQFTAEFGLPSFETEFGTIFLQAEAAVRERPSEVLFASPRQVQVMLRKLREQEGLAPLSPPR